MNLDVFQLFITIALVKFNQLGGLKMLFEVARKIVIHRLKQAFNMEMKLNEVKV
jgi:hypothetical protein